MKKPGAPTTVKLNAEEEAFVTKLQGQTDISKSDIIRRAVRYAGPKFLSGEVNLLTLVEAGKA
jgi:hypothetical protein